jgi:hypothetical protein
MPSIYDMNDLEIEVSTAIGDAWDYAGYVVSYTLYGEYDEGYMWSSTEHNAKQAYGFGYNWNYSFTNEELKYVGAQVRCIK